MIFPFKITFKKELKIKTNAPEEDILLLIKSEVQDNISPSTFKDAKMLKNKFTFKLNHWLELRRIRDGGMG